MYTNATLVQQREDLPCIFEFLKHLHNVELQVNLKPIKRYGLLDENGNTIRFFFNTSAHVDIDGLLSARHR